MFPIISSSGISGFHSNYMAEGPGVVTGRYGTLGLVFFEKGKFWPLNTTLYVKNFKGNDPLFISYMLRSMDFYAYSDKAAVPGLNRNDLHLAPVTYPASTLEQQRIARILSSLDEKIDLNQRTNETLDAMARTIFKDWFVDFGPTLAKVEGRAPYLAPELWRLFPERMHTEAQPENWPVRRVDEILGLAYGKALPAPSRLPGPYPVYGSGGITGFHATCMAPAPSIIVGRKGTVGSLFWEDRPSFPIDTVFYVVPKQAPMTFCFYLLRSLGLENMNSDAAVPGLNRNNVYRLAGAWGTPELHRHFDAAVASIRVRIAAMDEEVRTLASTRDLLLPQLMSGDLRVREAEKMVEAVL